MFNVLKFLKLTCNPFLKLVQQEQKLHCNSIYGYLVNSNLKVNLDVKNTIKDLYLALEDNVIRSKGRLKHADLPIDAQVPQSCPIDLNLSISSSLTFIKPTIIVVYPRRCLCIDNKFDP